MRIADFLDIGIIAFLIYFVLLWLRQKSSRTMAMGVAVIAAVYVLAHSLGGLIVQLDAAQALLVAGKTAELASRLHDARDLAVSGFSEARHAVDTLGEDESLKQVTGDELRESLSALVRAHRGLGRTIEFESGPLPQALGEEASRALRRALQESLTNARKHAPSSAVSASVHWDGSLLTLEVSNPLARLR